jgi:cytochrome c oxidase subunit 4
MTGRRSIGARASRPAPKHSTAKAALVALYFMHLRYDRPLHALIFLIGLVMLTLFLALTMIDTLQYRPTIETWQESGQR